MLFQEKIKKTFGKLKDLIDQSNPQELVYTPSAESWSILECVEHIHIVNSGILRILQTPLPDINENTQPELFGEGKINHLLITKRAIKQTAPEHVIPQGLFKNSNDAKNAIQKDLQDILQLLNTRNFLDETVVIQHFRLGGMTKTDWIHFLIAHTERHLFQLEDIKSAYEKDLSKSSL